MNEIEISKATEFSLVGCDGKDSVPPRPSGSFSTEIKKRELPASERAMWDLYDYQRKTGKPRIVRVKNPFEILFGVNGV